jgi:hypothetical protein
LIDRTNHTQNVIGENLAGQAIAPQRIGDLVQSLLGFPPGSLTRILQMRDIALEQIRHCTRPRVAGDLNAAPALDDVGVVPLEHLAGVGQGHRRIVADLGLGPLPVAPLLSHPLRGHPRRHRL